MKKCLLLTSVLLILSSSVFAMTIDSKKPLEKIAPYPTIQGFNRHVIYLPTLKNEHERKIELVMGKRLTVDCNEAWLTAQFNEKNLEGWGYSYYIVSDVDGPMSTKMACPNNEKSKQFVSIHLDPIKSLLPYNSKLPIVVYAPKGLEVKYRIWSDSTTQPTGEVQQDDTLLTHYPEVKIGFKRDVLWLPALKNENETKIQLSFTKKMEVDCNRHQLGAKFSEQTVDGLGYPYSVLYDVEGPISTMMACPDSKKVASIPVNLEGKNVLFDYNSQLPLVSYMPEDVTLQYHYWHVSNKLENSIIK